MKVHIIYSAFRESYKQPRIQEVYLDLSKADNTLEAWNKDNEDNCEEVRFLSSHEVIE